MAADLSRHMSSDYYGMGMLSRVTHHHPRAKVRWYTNLPSAADVLNIRPANPAWSWGVNLAVVIGIGRSPRP